MDMRTAVDQHSYEDGVMSCQSKVNDAASSNATCLFAYIEEILKQRRYRGSKWRMRQMSSSELL